MTPTSARPLLLRYWRSLNRAQPARPMTLEGTPERRLPLPIRQGRAPGGRRTITPPARAPARGWIRVGWDDLPERPLGGDGPLTRVLPVRRPDGRCHGWRLGPGPRGGDLGFNGQSAMAMQHGGRGKRHEKGAGRGGHRLRALQRTQQPGLQRGAQELVRGLAPGPDFGPQPGLERRSGRPGPPGH